MTPLQQAVKNLIDRWNSPIDWPEHLALRKALDAELHVPEIIFGNIVEPVAFKQFLSDVVTAAGLVAHGKQCKALGERISDGAFQYMLHPPQQVAVAPANNNWLIRKEPNTKDSYYVAEGNPPNHVLEIYGITAQGEKP